MGGGGGVRPKLDPPVGGDGSRATKPHAAKFLRPYFRSSNHGVHHIYNACTAQVLPNEVLDNILQDCTRFTLYNCCLLNRNLYRLSVAYLYLDPFYLDQADYAASRDKTPLNFPETLQRGNQLCTTISKHPDLADLIRTFRSAFWLDRVQHDVEGLFLPHLRNLNTAILHGQYISMFALGCRSTKLQRLYIGNFTMDPHSFSG